MWQCQRPSLVAGHMSMAVSPLRSAAAVATRGAPIGAAAAAVVDVAGMRATPMPIAAIADTDRRDIPRLRVSWRDRAVDARGQSYRRCRCTRAKGVTVRSPSQFPGSRERYRSRQCAQILTTRATAPRMRPQLTFLLGSTVLAGLLAGARPAQAASPPP